MSLLPPIEREEQAIDEIMASESGIVSSHVLLLEGVSKSKILNERGTKIGRAMGNKIFLSMFGFA